MELAEGIECWRRKRCRFIVSVVKTGKRSDGEQCEEERDGASEQSEEVMTKSRM